MKTIEIIVAPDGKTSVETRGFQGDGCRSASGALERALGLKKSDAPTAEYFQQSHSDHVQEGLG